MSDRNKPPLTEPQIMTDIFCSELARLEINGSWARLTFAVRRRPVWNDGKEERLVAACIVLPKEAALAIGQIMPYDRR